jgi:hypothetical protein
MQTFEFKKPIRVQSIVLRLSPGFVSSSLIVAFFNDKMFLGSECIYNLARTAQESRRQIGQDRCPVSADILDSTLRSRKGVLLGPADKDRCTLHHVLLNSLKFAAASDGDDFPNTNIYE